MIVSARSQLTQQPLRQHRGDLAPVVRRRHRAAHRTDLLLHQLADGGLHLFIDRLADEEQVLPPVRSVPRQTLPAIPQRRQTLEDTLA